MAQAEKAADHQAIFDSIQTEAEVEANGRFLHQQDAKLDEICADMESNEEPEVHLAANDPEADSSGTNFINISDGEDDWCSY